MIHALERYALPSEHFLERGKKPYRFISFMHVNKPADIGNYKAFVTYRIFPGQNIDNLNIVVPYSELGPEYHKFINAKFEKQKDIISTNSQQPNTFKHTCFGELPIGEMKYIKKRYEEAQIKHAVPEEYAELLSFEEPGGEMMGGRRRTLTKHRTHRKSKTLKRTSAGK